MYEMDLKASSPSFLSGKTSGSSEIVCGAREKGVQSKPIAGLSAFVITRDEADRIERCLRSVMLLAEGIILVDCGSTDGTIERAAALGARGVSCRAAKIRLNDVGSIV